MIVLALLFVEVFFSIALMQTVLVIPFIFNKSETPLFQVVLHHSTMLLIWIFLGP